MFPIGSSFNEQGNLRVKDGIELLGEGLSLGLSQTEFSVLAQVIKDRKVAAEARGEKGLERSFIAEAFEIEAAGSEGAEVVHGAVGARLARGGFPFGLGVVVKRLGSVMEALGLGEGHDADQRILEHDVGADAGDDFV